MEKLLIIMLMTAILTLQLNGMHGNIGAQYASGAAYGLESSTEQIQYGYVRNILNNPRMIPLCCADSIV